MYNKLIYPNTLNEDLITYSSYKQTYIDKEKEFKEDKSGENKNSYLKNELQYIIDFINNKY